MPTQEYICELGHIEEVRTGYENVPATLPCPTCGQLAEKQSVYLFVPFTESGVHRISPVPRDERRVKVSRFKEAAEELNYQYGKAEVHEDNRPNYFREGLRRAHAVAAGKEAPPKEKF